MGVLSQEVPYDTKAAGNAILHLVCLPVMFSAALVEYGFSRNKRSPPWSSSASINFLHAFAVPITPKLVKIPMDIPFIS